MVDAVWDDGDNRRGTRFLQDMRIMGSKSMCRIGEGGDSSLSISGVRERGFSFSFRSCRLNVSGLGK